MRLSETESKDILADLGFLPGTEGRQCQKCGQPVRVYSNDKPGKPVRDPKLRCNRSCGWEMNAIRAYTPLFDATTTFCQYLRVVYCFAMQLRVDQTVWMAGLNETKVHEMRRLPPTPPTPGEPA